MENFCLHLDIQINEPKILSVAEHLLYQHIGKILQEIVLSSERDEKNHLATLHTESRSILYVPEKGKRALTPATTDPVSWSQLFLQ